MKMIQATFYIKNSDYCDKLSHVTQALLVITLHQLATSTEQILLYTIAFVCIFQQFHLFSCIGNSSSCPQLHATCSYIPEE